MNALGHWLTTMEDTERDAVEGPVAREDAAVGKLSRVDFLLLGKKLTYGLLIALVTFVILHLLWR